MPSIQLIPQYPVINGSVTLSVTGITERIETIGWYKGPNAMAQYIILSYSPGSSFPPFNGPQYNPMITYFSNGSLHIRDVHITDGGNYIVKIQTSKQEDISVTLTVYNGPDKAVIEGPEYVGSGSSITLTCSADSFPTPEYQWKVNDTILEEKTRKYDKSNAKTEDQGIYTCVVRNPVTLHTATASVYVNVTAEFINEVNVNSIGLGLGLAFAIILGVVLIIIGSVCLYRKFVTKRRNESSEKRHQHILVYENVKAVKPKEESSYMGLQFISEETYSALKT
ncbi:CXADR-like membrane protein [Rhinoderma darwinii]|uniref:CXADR-like membrane protein n=1 Tax=Rhinoderma darwinii TaxID=43563 RepID=UPI003F674D1F